MVKAVQLEREEAQSKAKEERIQRNELNSGIQIEIKKYKITELSALSAKYKKVDAKLCVEFRFRFIIFL